MALPVRQMTFDFGAELAQAVRELPPREELSAKAQSLARQLSRNLGMAVRLAVTDNRSTMVSFRRVPGALTLRTHHMFLDAPEPVVKAIADYAGRGRSSAGRIIDEYIRVRQPLIRRHRDPSASELNPVGSCFQLKEVFDALNQQYFEGKIQAAIGWGRMPKKRRRKTIRLGVYDHQSREIRIHPALDRPEVPLYFIEFIVYHEMLHQLFPSSHDGNRRVHHPPAFRQREKAFEDYHAALEWERANLGLLLRASRSPET